MPAGLSNVVAVAGGVFHSLALKSNGTVAAWGDYFYGQTNIPSGLSNVVAIAAGWYHSLALKSDGTVIAWGAGTNNTGISPSYGQSIIPAGLSNVVALAGGGYHSLALKSDGTVVAWGRNSEGQRNVPAGLNTIPFTISGSVNTNAPGSYPLTYTATNSLGGIGRATRTVVVADTLPPAITVLGNNPFTNQINAPFVDPGASSFDLCAQTSFPVTTNSTVNISVPGTYAVAYSATDSHGNTATNTRTVLVVNLNQPVPFTLAGSSQLIGGAFQLSFTNLAGLPFTVLGSTNVALPLTNWTVLGAPVENPAGTYQFTDPQATNNQQRYYRVTSP